MGYCRRCLLRGALLRSILPLLVCCWFGWMGWNWSATQANINAAYQVQAQELGFDAPLTQVEADWASWLFYAGAGLFAVILGLQFIPVLLPARSKLARSIGRYERYAGEGDLNELIAEVDEDVMHMPTFGSIVIGNEWLLGRTGMTSYGGVRQDALCAAFYFHMEKRGQGVSGVPTSSKEYALVVLDSQFRDTIFLSVQEKPIMGAYRALCRRHEAMIRGDLDDYIAFLSLEPEERERALNRVEQANYAKKYLHTL